MMIDIDQLKKDESSFLSLDCDDPILYKLETYRLRRAGYSVTEIAKVFGFARTYLYQLWDQFKAEGIEALVKKNWGSTPRKTTQLEAAIIRAKALNPERSDKDLAEEFGVHRITVFKLLKEHGIQDLHKVIKGR